jgi:hypothetical protein
MSDHSNNDLPARAAKKDADLDRRVRVGIGSLPLAQWQAWAEQMAFADGKPLSEDEARAYIRCEHDAGTGRADIRRALVVDDQLDRRIGSLGPVELNAILAEEWPVSS